MEGKINLNKFFRYLIYKKNIINKNKIKNKNQKKWNLIRVHTPLESWLMP